MTADHFFAASGVGQGELELVDRFDSVCFEVPTVETKQEGWKLYIKVQPGFLDKLGKLTMGDVPSSGDASSSAELPAKKQKKVHVRKTEYAFLLN